jgi:hypothetical protein
MSLLGIHIISDDKLKALRAAASAAGHDVVLAEKGAVSALWEEAKTKYPEIVADIRQGIADVQDSTLSGGDKAVKVALDVMAAAPDVLKALPSAKDFFVHAVTEVYTETKTALIDAAEGLLGRL